MTSISYLSVEKIMVFWLKLRIRTICTDCLKYRPQGFIPDPTHQALNMSHRPWYFEKISPGLPMIFLFLYTFALFEPFMTKINSTGTSLVIQRLGICFPMQRTQVRPW